MTDTIEQFIARAIGDPGSILEREPDESVSQWSTRAVMGLLRVMYGPDSEGFYSGTPASRALLENAELRGKLADAESRLGFNRKATKVCGEEVVQLRARVRELEAQLEQREVQDA